MTRVRPLLLLTLTLAAPALPQSLENVVLRNSFSPAGAGARGAGMGGAFLAVADDGTAASFNPAGLAQLRRTELAVVWLGRRLDSRIESGQDFFAEAGGAVTRQAPDFAGIAVPLDVGGRRLTLQLSYQRSVDLFGRGRASIVLPGEAFPAEVPPGVDLDYGITLSSEQTGALHTFSLATGVEVAGPLQLGASVELWLGDWRAAGREVGEVRLSGGPFEQPVSFRDQDDTFTQDQGLSGLGVTLGGLLRGRRASLGAVLRLPFAASYRLDEETLANPTPDEPEQTTTRHRMRSRLRWPLTAGIGLALRPLRGLTLAGDLVHTRWSQTVLEGVPNGALLSVPLLDSNGIQLPQAFVDRNFFDLYPASQTITQDASTWRAGAEYLLSLARVVVPLRAGAFTGRSPVPDLGAVGRRRVDGFSCGLGLNFPRLVLDVAYERRRTGGAIGATLSADLAQSTGTFASERSTDDRLTASLIVRLGQTGGDDPIARGLGKLFGR